MIRTLLVAVCSFVVGICLTAFVLHADDDHAALMRHHELQRTAHLTYDAEKFADLLTDPIINVANGEITERTREQNLERLGAYFGSVVFDKWDDIDAPIVRISADGTLAAMIVTKQVVLSEKAAPDQKSETIFAWISLFEKVEGEWKVFAVASTRASE